MDRRTLLTAMLGTAASALWTPPDAFALGLPKDRIKRIRYYKTPTDAAGRPNIHQPTFNQSTNIVTIETESGLMGVGEGGVDDPGIAFRGFAQHGHIPVAVECGFAARQDLDRGLIQHGEQYLWPASASVAQTGAERRQHECLSIGERHRLDLGGNANQ